MSVHEEVTLSILVELEQKVLPWVHHWQPHLPQNFVSGREYTGINVVLLWSRGYTNPFWLTFRQAKALGGTIKKGAKATHIVSAAKEATTWSRIFNLEQTEGIPIPQVEEKQPSDIMDEAETFIAALGAKILLGAPGSFYRIPRDEIHLPQPDHFNHMASYYSTSLHEHMHWSGHASRLNRYSLNNYGEEYAAEELVAELGAAFLCSHLQIPIGLREDHAAYLPVWLRLLKHDTRAIVKAGALAAQACGYLQDKVGINREGVPQITSSFPETSGFLAVSVSFLL